MVPQTFPSTLNRFTLSRQMRAFRLSSVTGLTRWVDYIPIKLADAAVPGKDNHHDADGYISMDFIDSTTGLVNGVDYLPVYIDNSATVPWQVSATGYVPYGLSGMGGASLVLEFAKGNVSATSLDPRVTFTRASTGTYFDSAGVLQRATYNLFTRSEEFDNAAWTKGNATITANAVAAPDGTLTADKLVEDTATNQHIISQNIGTVTVGSAYTVSCYIKAAERTQASLTSFGEAYVVFNLSAGTVIQGTGQIQNVGNGWYRCSATFTKTNTTGAFYILAWNNTNNYLGDGQSGIYIWGAQLEAASTAGPYYATTTAANGAPRFTYNPATGEALGLLIEEQRTNSIRNNTMMGAVAGTPGTLPTNWFIFTGLTGLTRQVVGTGVEAGITYIDFRLSGTPNTAGVYLFGFETGSSISASNGQTWTASVYTKLSGGSLTNVGVSQVITERDSAGNELVRSAQAFTPTTAALTTQRNTVTRTNTNASTVYELSFLQFDLNGGAIDFTLRIGLPQLEQGAFATSVIPTTTTAATRSADAASMTGTNFSSWYNASEGTLYAEAIAPSGVSSAIQSVASITNSSNDGRILLYRSTVPAPVFQGDIPGAQQFQITSGSWANGSVQKLAGAYKVNDFAASFNAGTVGTDTLGTLPTVDRLIIGDVSAANRSFCGTIRKIAFYPQRVTNAQLQALTR